MSKPVKVWVTKRALTRGIELATVDVKGPYAYATDRWRTQYPPWHWHRDCESAIAKAEQMRAAKVASLKKQIVALENLTFRKASDA